jgi:methyl-accepting chemotaxis protein
MVRVGLRFKLLGTLLFGALLSAAGGAVSDRLLSHALGDYRSLLAEEVAAERLVLQTRAAFKEQVQEWKDTLLRGGDPSLLARHWSQFEAREQEVRERASAVEALLQAHGAADTTLASGFIAAHAGLGRDYREALAVFTTSGFDAHKADSKIRGRDREPTRMLVLLATNLENAEVARALAVDAATDRARNLATILLALAALLGCAAAALLINLLVERPLRRLISLAGNVSRGDLTHTLVLETKDELAELAQTFSRLIIRLREVPQQLSASVGSLSEVVSVLNSTSTEQQQVLTRQATALQETQVTAQEIKQTAVLASEKSLAILELAEHGETLGAEGREAIERTLHGFEDLRMHVEAMTERIAGLRELIRSADLITLAVKDIADQSNMLALNAAIEAVRSGEHGRGFAVVAKEIRSLADQSIASTARVRTILQNIEHGISDAVALSEKGQARVQHGIGQVQASGETLGQLIGTVKNTNAAVRQIAAAVSQQGAGVLQIFGAVNDQSKMMVGTMAATEALTQSIARLREVSAGVDQVVRSYKVSSQRG